MKKITLFSALLASLLVLTACSKAPDASPANNAPTVPTGGQATGQPSGGQPGGMRRPDFGQPDKPADLRGIVKSVVGNQVVIFQIPNQVRRASSTPDQTPNGSTSANSARFSLGAGGQGGGHGGGRGVGGFGGPGGGGQGTDRAAMLEQLKKMSTGEDTIIIPVGIKMMKSSSANGKREMIEAALTDVTPDKSLVIWLNATVTDKKVAEFVLIN
jgi:hypothetical protein